jgi:hypothetical protein
MIREFDAETGSRQTASSAKQSAIFAFPAENSKIVRMCAHFLLLRGTGEGQIRAAITFLAGLSLPKTVTVANAGGEPKRDVNSDSRIPRG